jgi:hypothetical protein
MLALALVLVLVEQMAVAHAVAQVARDLPFGDEDRDEIRKVLSRMHLPNKAKTLVADALSDVQNR